MATGDILSKFHRLLSVGSKVCIGISDVHMNMMFNPHFSCKGKAEILSWKYKRKYIFS
jgi:hypothetical protein